jgi:glucose dehydrogenase
MRYLGRFLLIAAIGLACAGAQPAIAQSSTRDDWAYYGHDAGGTRYSPLTQVNRQNVAGLKRSR